MKEGISVRRQMLWGLLIVLIAGVAGTALWIRQGGRLRREMRPERPLEGSTLRLTSKGLGVFGRVPEFSLTERSDRKMELSDLAGKVWIVLTSLFK